MALKNELVRQGMILKSDAHFNQYYPRHIQDLSSKHWTPLSVARKAAGFLATGPGVKILDIGSGVGKFCIVGGLLYPEALFYGVEQRSTLCAIARSAQSDSGAENVHFIHRNFTQLNLTNYNHFYVFNPFYENLTGTEKIDDSIAYSSELYHYYNRYLFRQLQKTPVGTRVVTYHGLDEEIPVDFHIVGTDMDNWLKYWIKV